MIVARGREELRAAREGVEGRLALVPTMGYLHEGHLTLVDRAGETSDAVAASIFVNPLQFGPGEDLESYPRDEERDLALLEERGVSLVFAPDDRTMYPRGEPRVTVDPGPGAGVLCGRYRPGHFRGVLTVVAKLFGLVRPDVAVFGRKDYQQGVLVRRMVEDLELGVEILLGPIVREDDGLAMSSRNAYLSPAERAQATALHGALVRARERFRGGETSAPALTGEMAAFIRDHPLLREQYAELVDPDTLEPVSRVRKGSVAAVAAFCGDTRLIDNLVME